MVTFGERLKLLRKRKNLSQHDMAKFLDITDNGYQKYELNKSTPHFNTLILLADFFNVSLDYLVGRSDDDTPPNYGSKNNVK